MTRPAARPAAGDLLVGTASGLAAGLVGALVMTGFQSLLARGGVTSGVKGSPSTEKAANRVSRLAVGRPVPRQKQAAAGDAVHNVFGAVVGGVYGAAAEFVPQVTGGRGAQFGVAAATVVDEGLVPAFGLGDPFWKAPLRSHPYSYVSHIVFGTVTELSRRLFRRFFRRVKDGAKVALERTSPPVPLALAPAEVATVRGETGTAGPSTAPVASDAAPSGALPAGSSAAALPAAPSRHILPLAFLLGACAGPRTSAPIAVISWAARLGWIDVKGSPLAALASPRAVATTTPMAIGELVVDKLPSTPARTQPVGVVARAASGAVSGAALAGGRSPAAAFAGAAGALAATFVGHALRVRLSRTLGRDWPVAAVEDVLAFGGATMVCLAALAPDTPKSAVRRAV